MIHGFSEYTHELTPYEKDTLLPVFIRGLEKKQGAAMAVTNKEMVAALKAKGYKVSDARVRKIINHIRTHSLIPGLVASSKGYYISSDPVEIMKYVDSLKQRANEINRVKDSMVLYVKTLIKAS